MKPIKIIVKENYEGLKKGEECILRFDKNDWDNIYIDSYRYLKEYQQAISIEEFSRYFKIQENDTLKYFLTVQFLKEDGSVVERKFKYKDKNIIESKLLRLLFQEKNNIIIQVGDLYVDERFNLSGDYINNFNKLSIIKYLLQRYTYIYTCTSCNVEEIRGYISFPLNIEYLFNFNKIVFKNKGVEVSCKDFTNNFSQKSKVYLFEDVERSYHLNIIIDNIRFLFKKYNINL